MVNRNWYLWCTYVLCFCCQVLSKIGRKSASVATHFTPIIFWYYTHDFQEFISYFHGNLIFLKDQGSALIDTITIYIWNKHQIGFHSEKMGAKCLLSARDLSWGRLCDCKSVWACICFAPNFSTLSPYSYASTTTTTTIPCLYNDEKCRHLKLN